MLESEIGISKMRATFLSLGVASIGLGIWGITNNSAERDRIVWSIPGCKELNLGYSELGVQVDNFLWDTSRDWETLAREPKFRKPIECYRNARSIIESQGLDPNGGKTSVTLLTTIVGFFTTMIAVAGTKSRHYSS